MRYGSLWVPEGACVLFFSFVFVTSSITKLGWEQPLPPFPSWKTPRSPPRTDLFARTLCGAYCPVIIRHFDEHVRSVLSERYAGLFLGSFKVIANPKAQRQITQTSAKQYTHTDKSSGGADNNPSQAGPGHSTPVAAKLLSKKRGRTEIDDVASDSDAAADTSPSKAGPSSTPKAAAFKRVKRAKTEAERNGDGGDAGGGSSSKAGPSRERRSHKKR